MKIFKKLALCAAVAASGNAFAMQELSDDALSEKTGQDGISIAIQLGEQTVDGETYRGIGIDQMYIHDNDGLATNATTPSGAAIAGGTATAGAIIVNDIVVKQTDSSADLANVVIDTDAGSAADGAFLNVALGLAGMEIDTGEISVGASGDLADNVRGIKAGTDNNILKSFGITLGSMDANIQLGSTPQGSMIALNSELQGGLSLDDVVLEDEINGGSIVIKSIGVSGEGNASGDLTINAKLDVTPDGLRITNESTQGLNMYVSGVRLGTDDIDHQIGDVEISNLQMGNSTITVSGH